ncbi:MAG TPA: SHOCT domain-containing protein [Solirubrobacterales bacterium]|nr:SHOCT domain-containing protein [Solirubrobacterales bacterium]
MARTAVVAGTATAVSGRVARRQQARYAEQDAQVAVQRQTYADQAYAEQAPPRAAAPAEPDYTAELERLAKLRDDGVITAEDFEAKKKQLLGI